MDTQENNVKKIKNVMYIIFYLIIIIIALIMIFTKGFQGNILIYTYDDSWQYNDAGETIEVYLSLLNCLIMGIIIILSTVITFNKKNKNEFRWIFYVAIILLCLFFPLGTMTTYTVSIFGGTEEISSFTICELFLLIVNRIFS